MRKIVVTPAPEVIQEVERLLGTEAPQVPIGFHSNATDQYIRLADVQELLTTLADQVMSDQKQEAYRGLRKFFHALWDQWTLPDWTIGLKTRSTARRTSIGLS